MSVLKVLVVDDEPGIRSGAKRILKDFKVGYPFMDEDFSFDIIEAETGEKAIELIESISIDIILLDNKLPGIDGIEVLEYINEMQYDISVMMITSYASLDLAVKATNNGAFNFVPKPFTPLELKTSVDNITKNLFLKRMTKKLNEESKQIRFQFLSVLSHELKSPLNAMEGYLKIMQEKQVGESVDDYMEMIERSMERIKGMRSLILDLLDLTRMESGKKTRDLRKIDVHEIIKRIIDSMEALAKQKNIKIYFDGSENTFFLCDNHEMEIIISNFVSNAIKYNVDNGEVYVNLNSTPKELIISVEDTGIGMSSDEILLLFKDFVRIKNNKTKYVTGSGLGLSIAKKMAELYNGHIDVESEPDKGTKFTITLPAE
jgi:two-component system, sensor histidine kinase and response regulator